MLLEHRPAAATESEAWKRNSFEDWTNEFNISFSIVHTAESTAQLKIKQFPILGRLSYSLSSD